MTWRQLIAGVATRLGGAGIASANAEARWMAEEASGVRGAAFVLQLDEVADEPARATFEAMVVRRLAGEPLQYVLGRWGFRALDLIVDPRVLIPRPETEQVVEAALAEIDRAPTEDGHAANRAESTSNRRRRVTAVDLGCGSGAIGLSIAAERDDVDVWCVDSSPAALAVTRQNMASLDPTATARVAVVEGSWFEPLPPELLGAVDLIVTNPPYVAAGEELPAEVAEWEPAAALVSGPTGLEAIEHIVREALRWLTPGGALVSEIGERQAARVSELAKRSAFAEVEIRRDLAGRDRILVARRPPR